MNKWFYGFLMLVTLTVAIAFTLKLGWEPAPVGIMKPSSFDSPQQVGAVVFRRFYAPIEQYKHVVVGIPTAPDWQKEVVRGMVLAAAQSPNPFNAIISDIQMPEINFGDFPNLTVERLPINTETQSEFIDRMRTLRAEGKRVLVYTATISSTHLLPDSPVNRYERLTGERLFTISSGPLALAPDQEYIVNPPCLGSERDATGNAPLGCAILRSGRGYYRKKVDQSKYVGVMVAPKPEDYLLMISEPGQNNNTDQLRKKALDAASNR